MIAASAVANAPVVTANATAPGAPPAEGREPGEFARLLDGASAATGKTAGTRATSANKVPPGKEPRKERVDKGEAPPNEATTKQSRPADVPTECPAGDAASAPGTDEDQTPVAGDPAALLATLPPLQPQRPYPAGNTGPVRTASGQAPAGGGVRTPVDDNDPAPAAPDLGDTRDTRNAARGASAGGVSFAETLREARTPAAAEARAAGAEQTALPLPAQTALATGVSASAPAEARIAATPGSADFATQLGVQLTTFVREGIQHARLELHPTELGPVTVQIQIDGNAAQVNLAAEQAPTRTALEQALPQLAGSLREAGLTLTGGGVFEQPRQPQADGGRGDGSTRSGSDNRSERDSAERASVTTEPLAAPRRRGVVDLVA